MEIGMDPESTPNVSEDTAVEGGETQEIQSPQTEVAPASGGNPAWEGVRSQLDPISFSKIEPELKKFDQSAQEHIERLNGQLKPYKPFIDEGINPDQIQSALMLSRGLDSNPIEIYNYLGDFLQRTGRMPTKQEVEDAEESGEIGEESATPDPAIEELRQQQEQMRQLIESQYQEKVQREADEALTKEIEELQTAYPDLTREDVREILSRAAYEAQTSHQTGKGSVPSLKDVHDRWFVELKTRFLNTPRPGDSAPRLLPTSGGVPGSSPSKSLGGMSREDVQSIIANGLKGNG